MKHWTQVPMAVDMACYADFYKKAVLQALQACAPDEKPVLVELGVRCGCSSRIILDALGPREAVFHLIDPVEWAEARELGSDPRVKFWKNLAEDVVGKFDDSSITFLHVDCDPHGYDQTKRIFDLYEPKITRQGIVVFHDCTPQFGVHEFVTKHLCGKSDWHVVLCPPHSDCPVSAPAKARRVLR